MDETVNIIFSNRFGDPLGTFDVNVLQIKVPADYEYETNLNHDKSHTSSGSLGQQDCKPRQNVERFLLMRVYCGDHTPK